MVVGNIPIKKEQQWRIKKIMAHRKIDTYSEWIEHHIRRDEVEIVKEAEVVAS